ncbi:hypothetical protein TNCV_4291351 [Trichonephila clavipes]|nr:hypothetical protein TNCV_4291351 [Trichonephila clavipes]
MPAQVLSLSLHHDSKLRTGATKTRQVPGLLHVKSAKTRSPLVGGTWKFGEGIPAHVSSLSLDRGSNTRFVTNSLRPASQCDAN